MSRLFVVACKHMRIAPQINFWNCHLETTTTTMYAIGAHVSLSQQGCPTVGNCHRSSPSGPEFLHIQYPGATDKVVDHTAAKLCRLEAVCVASPQLPGSGDDCHSPEPAPTAAPKAPTPRSEGLVNHCYPSNRSCALILFCDCSVLFSHHRTFYIITGPSMKVLFFCCTGRVAVLP